MGFPLKKKVCTKGLRVCVSLGPGCNSDKGGVIGWCAPLFGSSLNHGGGVKMCEFVSFDFNFDVRHLVRRRFH